MSSLGSKLGNQIKWTCDSVLWFEMSGNGAD